MELGTWLTFPLLWDAACYIQICSEELQQGKGLYSLLYHEEKEAAPFLQAIEGRAATGVGKFMEEARSLALGLPEQSTNVLNSLAGRTESFSLSAVLSNVSIRDNAALNSLCYPLPKACESDPFNTDLVESPVLDKKALAKHLEVFLQELKDLRSLNSHLKAESILTIIEKYFWCLPAFGVAKGSDIPCFASSKLAAAIISCWDAPTAIPQRNESAYALIQGKLSGIQKYLYSISSAKGAAKGLKGRSFELGLLPDTVARFLTYRFGLTLANVIFSGGGTFYLLAPHSALDELSELRNELENSFYQSFQGGIYLALGGIGLCGNDYHADTFSAKWQEVDSVSSETRNRKFATLIEKDFDRIFEPNGSGKPKTFCQSCGGEEEETKLWKRIDKDTGKERTICAPCQDREKLGQLLPHTDAIIEVYQEPKSQTPDGAVRLHPLVNISLVYYVIRKDAVARLDGEQLTYWGLTEGSVGTNGILQEYLPEPNTQFGYRFYGGKDIPINKAGEFAEYSDLAEASTGIKRLGVLRMDVDNLGRIFRYGLKMAGPRGESKAMAPPARMLALSWHFNRFFSYELNRIRSRDEYRNHVLVTYSGGDDLFVVGSWSYLIDFACDIRKAFRKATGNTQLTISGGLAMVPGKFPIHKAAIFAGDAEEAAKNLAPEKDAFTFLGKPLKWSDFEIAASLKQELVEAIKPTNGQKPLNKGILDRLRRLYLLYDYGRRQKLNWPRDTPVQMKEYMDALRYTKWRWMMTYSLKRYSEGHAEYRSLIERLQKGLLDNNWIDKNGKEMQLSKPGMINIMDFIDVPSRWAELLTRKVNLN